LLKVPVANLHVATVVIHALGELLCRTSAVVLGLLALSLDVRRGSSLNGRGRRAAAAEEATDGITDSGTDRDTTTHHQC